ncbi:MAG: formylglycine-generating enzyme family protein [Anaerolineae bacterium]|nr:formylglycine-generating enzyme family protein [Anaerolineae bacterium]
MRLTKEHYNQLRTALLDGFSVDELAATLRSIGHYLPHIASGLTNQREIVHRVIESAEKGDWVDVLVVAMKTDNPTNKKVNALPDHFPDANTMTEVETPEPPVRKRRKAGPVLPPDWPEPTISYTFISPTRIRSTIDGKEMVLVPGGEFLYGEDKVPWYLPPFWIDKTPVTNAEYKRFLDANPDHPVPYIDVDSDWIKPYNWDQTRRSFPSGKAQHPVVLVTWHDAVAYTEWAGKQLPTEHEWEKAARSTDGRIYPWGDTWHDKHANTREAGIGSTSPVGQFSPQGDSPFGCVDMSGNVWEWTQTPDARGGYRLRGGSFVNYQDNARVADVYRLSPGNSDDLLGFRVCAPSF